MPRKRETSISNEIVQCQTMLEVILTLGLSIRLQVGLVAAGHSVQHYGLGGCKVPTSMQHSIFCSTVFITLAFAYECNIKGTAADKCGRGMRIEKFSVRQSLSCALGSRVYGYTP